MTPNERHVLVTGGAGFIGSHLVDQLLERPDTRVTVLDKLTYAGSLDNLSAHEDDARFAFARGDVAEASDVLPLVGEADHVVHAAAESHVDRSIADGGVFVRTNVLGTQVVLEACRETGTPLLFVDTDEVYGAGHPGDSLFDEEAPLRPRNPYSASKAAADLLCQSYRATYGLPITIVRGTNAFGPRQHPEKAIPTYSLAALDGRTIPVYGEGAQRREWLFVSDWAAACLAVLDNGEPGRVYNVGGGHELTNLDLARTVCRLAGADPALIGFVPDRPGHDFRYGLTWTRLRALGWEPATAFEDGVAATIAWFRDHREWADAMRAGASA